MAEIEQKVRGAYGLLDSSTDESEDPLSSSQASESTDAVLMNTAIESSETITA